MRHKKSIPNRGFRIADQIQRDLAELIRGLKDPRLGLVTISGVDVSPDYAHAQVRFSVLVGDPTACEAALNEAAGWLRNGLFKRLAIHTVPTLHFKFDRSIERAAEMGDLIRRANATRAADADARSGDPAADADARSGNPAADADAPAPAGPAEDKPA